ncbi:MAG: hypothetical protein R3F31_22060 [Verrucomicrobiales bacterium]
MRYEEGTGSCRLGGSTGTLHIPSVLALGERVFGDDSGIVTCVKRADGAEVWKARLPGIEGKCFGSPVRRSQDILCGRTGNVHVIAVADELQTLGSMNRLGSPAAEHSGGG